MKEIAKFFFFLSLSLFLSLIPSILQAYPYNEEAYRYLDALAVDAGADKGSFYHNYTKIYSQYFDPIKNEPLKFLEIGVYKGASVKLWEKYFSRAELHFIDCDYSHLTYTPSRAQLHTADQANPQQLLAVMQRTGGGFDVILDDGGHTMPQQQTSFKTLFPYLKSGGIYIIEDLHTSYWAQRDGTWRFGDHPHLSKNSTVEFLKTLIDEVNFVGARTTKANHDVNLEGIRSQLNEYREQILSMTFYDSACIIIKR